MCTEQDCDRPLHAKGLCQPHYRQAQRRARGLKKPGPKPQPNKVKSRYHPTNRTRTRSERRVGPNDPARVARQVGDVCANSHPLTEDNAYTNPSSGQVVCRVCRMNWQRKRKGLPPLDRESVGTWNRHKTHCAQGHEYTPENTEHKDGRRTCKRCRKAIRIMKEYGITLADFERMLDGQDWRCWICRRDFLQESDAHIDHCHTSGAVRGLLCTDCNNGLGRFRDNPWALRRAADYLERFGIPESNELADTLVE